MNLAKLIEFLRDRLKAVTLAGIAVLVLVAAADILFVNNDEAHTRAEHFPAFWSIFGFVGCVLIIIVSKWFGHAGIMVREDYYEEALVDANTAGVRPSPGAATSEHSNAPGGSKPAAPEDGRTPKERHD